MASNIANIVFPGQFNPKTEKWCDYKEQLLCALDAAGYDESNRNKARSLFLSQCGKETFALIASLLVPNRPSTVDFMDIIGVLDQFYEPELNEILQAGKFHGRQQLQSESVQDFVAAISLLGAKCNFVDLKRQLRDRLVLGVRDARLRRELLKSKDLTYEVALQWCLNYQATFSDLYPDTKEMKQTPFQVNEPMDISRIKSNDCQHCARLHRPGEKCQFTRAKCYYCKRYGHIAAACTKKVDKVNKISKVEGTGEEVTLKEENMMGVYICSEIYHQAITVDVMIEGAKLCMEIDSGASRSIISEYTYKKLWIVPPSLNPTNIKLVTWTREPLHILGQINVHVRLGAKEARCDLIVVSGCGPSLLGRNWFQKLNIEIAGLHWSEDRIVKLRNDFPDLFADGLGEYKGPRVSVHVRADATPKFLKARVVPFPLKRQVNEELQKMVDQGILTPVKYSNWATPLHIVRKDDGSLRICGDYRSTVNAAIDVDSFPLPKSIEAFAKLSGGCIFSKLDLKQAYTQLKVDEKTASLLTLNTPIGLMKMNRLAFGVSAAPAIFQRVMSAAFANLEGVACLLDDIAIMGKNKDEHEKRLYAVLHKLHEMGFRLNVAKCIFGAESITFLGHMIDAAGLHPAPDKVKEIREKPAPTNKETLRAFLGLYNFYEKFLPDKATLLEPLYRLLDSKRPWKWGEPEQKAFETAKSLLSSDLTLVGYELDRDLLLICDSSDYGLGAIIAHVMDDGSEKPVMMASRTLQKHERRYGQIDKEAMAIIFGLSKFHEFLAGRRFCIITDHKPLIGLFNPHKPIPEQISPRMLRWSLKLGCYQYSIKYRAGKAIGNADALSRWTAPVATIQETALKEVLLLEETPVGWNLNASRVADETKKDPLLRKVMFHMLHGWPRSVSDPSLRPFWVRKEALSQNKDCLLWCNRVVIPISLQKEVLSLLHAPHAGIVQTKAYARGYVWWVGMDKEIERIVSECQQCQAVRNNPPRDPQTWIVSEKPWSRVHVDFAGPFQGKTFLLLIDSSSKWLEAETVTSINSTAVITVLRRIFASQGLPEVLVSDNGRTFSSNEFNFFLKKNGIKHLYSPPYHPASNGQIERAIQTFKNKLRKLSNLNIPWREKLDKVLYYMRTVPCSSMNKSPAEVLNGRKYRTSVSMLHPDALPNHSDNQLDEAAQRPPRRLFTVDQPVLICMYGPGEKWKRATVEMVEGPCSYMVRTEDGDLLRRHVDQMLSRNMNEAEQRNQVDDIPRPLSPESDANSLPDPPIEIPPPEMWPNIIGIPDTIE